MFFSAVRPAGKRALGDSITPAHRWRTLELCKVIFKNLCRAGLQLPALPWPEVQKVELEHGLEQGSLGTISPLWRQGSGCSGERGLECASEI